MVNRGVVVITIFLLPLLLDRWTDRQRKDKWTDRRINRKTDGWSDRQTDRWLVGWMDRQTDRLTDRQTGDGRTDGQTEAFVKHLNVVW